MRLDLKIVDSKGVKVVFCRGRLIIGEEVESFKTRVGGLLPGFPKLVLELRALDQIDSQGLGVIVDLRNKARELGGDVRLASLSGNSHVHRVLEATHFLPSDTATHPLEHHYFLLFDDDRRAVSSFTEPSKPSIGSGVREET